MGYFADIYVIKRTRSKELANEFINHFLPNNEERAECYELPQFGKETILEFSDVNKLIDYLEINPNEIYQIYWKNLDKENPNCFGMLFYTSDGCIIFGISRDTFISDNTNNEDNCLEEMKAFLDTDKGYITYENLPEKTHKKFLNVVNEFKIQSTNH